MQRLCESETGSWVHSPRSTSTTCWSLPNSGQAKLQEGRTVPRIAGRPVSWKKRRKALKSGRFSLYTYWRSGRLWGSGDLACFEAHRAPDPYSSWTEIPSAKNTSAERQIIFSSKYYLGQEKLASPSTPKAASKKFQWNETWLKTWLCETAKWNRPTRCIWNHCNSFSPTWESKIEKKNKNYIQKWKWLSQWNSEGLSTGLQITWKNEKRKTKHSAYSSI